MCASLSLKTILASVEEKCQPIFAVWDEVGIEGSELEEEVRSVIKQLDIVLDNILIDKETRKTQLSQSIDDLITYINEISSEINNTPFYPPKTTTLLKTYNFLLSEKERLLKDADSFIQEFNTLKNSERKLCSRLCETEITLNYKAVPSQEQIKLLRRRVEHLNTVKAERCAKFLELRSQMIAGYDKLGKSLRLVTDSCCLVKDILAPEALETFTLSEENMFSMSDIVDQLSCECARVDTECNVYRGRLNLLLQLLNPLGVSCDEVENENSSFTLRKKRMKEPSVLQNRGGILLKLEKERKQLLRDLPNLEAKIREAFSNLNIISPSLASAIRLGSENLDPVDFIKKSWESLQNDKENDKQNDRIAVSTNRTIDTKSAGALMNSGKNLKRPNPYCSNETIIVRDPNSNSSSLSSSSSILTNNNNSRMKQSRVVGHLKKPEIIKTKIDSRKRKSRSVPPGSRKILYSNMVLHEVNHPSSSKNILDDMNLCTKSTLTKQSVDEVESFFEGLKSNDKGGSHVSTFIH
ncbi:unnamed protein product [Schistosoma turkestanicum]|nr:unnamed protein product [Schistosoma turkestanicum]